MTASFRRCIVCRESYVTTVEAAHDGACGLCQSRGAVKVEPRWVEAWERSLAVQGRMWRTGDVA